VNRNEIPGMVRRNGRKETQAGAEMRNERNNLQVSGAENAGIVTQQ